MSKAFVNEQSSRESINEDHRGGQGLPKATLDKRRGQETRAACLKRDSSEEPSRLQSFTNVQLLLVLEFIFLMLFDEKISKMHSILLYYHFPDFSLSLMSDSLRIFKTLKEEEICQPRIL